MKFETKRLLKKCIAIATLFCMATQTTFAALLNLATVPLFLGVTIPPPMVMLNIPKDHQLFTKLYNDFGDVDGDGVIDTVYTHSIDYYGYFDPTKCYTYTNSRFEPASISPTKYCTGQWSGNFLNWVAMARLDGVRKLLYGGFRTVDQDGLTVLERTSVATDGHAWAKHYRGGDIDRVTPFTNIELTEKVYTATTLLPRSIFIPAQGAIFGTAITGNPISFIADNPATGRYLVKGDQVRIDPFPAVANTFMTGVVQSAPTGLAQTITVFITSGSAPAGGLFSTWRITNLSSPGISICNTTITAETMASHDMINVSVYPPTTKYPPLMRFARGDFGLWAVSDGKMCQFSGKVNGNIFAESDIKANRESPVQAEVGLATGGAGPDFNVRVKVCDPALIGTEKCRQYENGNWKPIGLLQQYGSGDSKLIQFGLMTPSYGRSNSGAVLRKHVSFLDARPAIGQPGYSPYTPAATDELDPRTINAIQLYGYEFKVSPTEESKYRLGNDNCDNPGIVNPGDDKCTSWGNPTSEMFLETIRYLAGKTVNKDYVPNAPAAGTYDDGGLVKDRNLNLFVRGWTAPVTSANWCAPLNVIVMNASVTSYDADQALNDLFPAGQTANTFTNDVGKLEGFTSSTTVLIGSNDGPIQTLPASGKADPRGMCTPKPLSGANGLGDITGICPEAPVISGSYLVAGTAHWARNNRISSTITRADGSAIPANDFNALRVNTYGITLTGTSPKIEIRVPGSNPPRFVKILPSGRTLTTGGANAGNGSILDFKVVQQDSTSGKFFVTYEDSLQGNDYDLDAWGVISYQFLNGGQQIRVTTDVIYGQSGFTMGFGYVIGGVTGGTIDATGVKTYGDGVHFVSAHRANNPDDTKSNPQFDWPPEDTTIGGVTVAKGAECNDCQQQDGARSVTFDVAASQSATGNVVLEDPLFYAGKYGGFKDFNKNGVRDAGEWDSKVSGQPDNYFLVTNPARLEEALEESFISILAQASASSVATNSTSLQTNTTIYQARFNANDWSGQVLAFGVQPNGTINATPDWDAGDLLKKGAFDPNTRTVITYNTDAAKRDGVPFRVADISPDLLANLNTNPASGAVDNRAQERLDYLRGDSTNEGVTGTKFRTRPVTKLGDIVNSNPIFVGPPNAGFGESSYVTFRQQFASRKPMLFVSANDAMLHAFSADENGKEYMAYIPSKTFKNLNKLTNKAYQHRYFVDGSPEVQDAFINVSGTNQWRTVLVGALASGGQGVFALDVTDPEEFKLEANAAKTVLWEFNDSDDPNLGYVLGQPVIRKMANDRWAAIFTGGYNNSEVLSGETACTTSDLGPGPGASPPVPAGCTTSSTGRAYLYIVFLDGPTGANNSWRLGTDYIRIDTGAGSVGTPNGLAAPFATDVNVDGRVDFIYAGDLLGNMFKFDVRSASTSAWNNASNQVILYTATTSGAPALPQPITARAEGTPHPTGQGFIITFGTGKYLEPSDPNAPFALQTFYGIWDKNDSTPISGQTTVSNRTQLLQQTISNVSNLRVVSTNVADWSTDTTPPTADDSPPKDMGWFMDFPNSSTTGERSVFRPLLLAGRLIFTTLLPNTAACEAGGTSFLMIVDPFTGGRLDTAVLDTNANGQLNTADKITFGGTQVYASGVQSTIGITPTPTIVRGGTVSSGTPGTGELIGTTGPLLAGSGFLMAYAIAAGSSGGNASTVIGLAATGGRVSWREILAQ
jgi:type IV pilus assembly protein PilY1